MLRTCRISSLSLAMIASLILNAIASGQATQPATQPGSKADDPSNPAMPGFDREDSDAKAIQIADEVMKAMGGRQAWDDTRYITWRFFGRNLHVWDKKTGDTRVEFIGREGEHYTVVANLNTKKGRAWLDGEPITDSDQVQALIKNAISSWINDSYWLLMPYKLKDSGVTLKYKGEADMEDGRPADVLQLTFKGVGDTPDNKYDVYVAKDSGLVEQWSYYRNAADAEPTFTGAWHDWKRYGKILLSDDRGVMRGNPMKHTDIAVFDELPASVFESPEPFRLEDYQPHKESSMNGPLEKLAPLLGSWAGTFSIHGEDGESVVESFPIRWETAPSFDGRYLRFEFSSVEPRSYGYAEFLGLFTPGEDGESVETVWVSPLIRRQAGRFLSSRTLFCETGRFDSSGTVLTLESEHQYGPDEPAIAYRSVFTLAGPDRFTVVDSAFDDSAGRYVKKFTFDLARD